MIDFFEVKKLKILGKVTNEPKKYSAEVRTYGTNYDGGISPPVIYPYIDNIQEFPGKVCGEINTEPEIGEEYIILTVSDTLILVTDPKVVEDIHYMMMDYYKNFKYKMRNLVVELENKIDREENRFDQNWWC